VVFLAGDAEAEASAEADVFFEVVAVPLAVLFFVVVALVVVPVDVAVVSSFFWVWQPRNAVNASAVIKDKTDVFIGLVKLNKVEDVDPFGAEQALNRQFFPFKSLRFSCS
jgi:hypothetical protein